MDPQAASAPSPANKERRRAGRFPRDAHARQVRRVQKRERDPVVQVVYTTLSPTFTGSIAGYTTLSDMPLGPTPRELEHALATPSGGADDPALPTIIQAPSATQDVGSESLLVQAGPRPTPIPTSHSSTKAAPPTSVESMAHASQTHSGPAPGSDAARGDNAGKKAGIAFGVVGGVMFLVLIAFLLYHRRKEARRERLDDEKFRNRAGGEDGDGKRAPRISLRPVTQFFPALNMDKGGASGSDMALTPGIALTTDPHDRSESANSSNPFGFYAERIPTPIHEEDEEHEDIAKRMSPRDLTSDKHAFQEHPGKTKRESSLGDGSDDNAADTASSLEYVASGSASTRKTSMMSLNPNQIDLTMPPSQQVPLNFAMDGDPSDIRGHTPSPSMGAAAIEAAGGPANSTVHRVQLSFKPTLSDELEINAGDLIRLLHEYDDGWALVIRLDRSQQGVVPRTCLSAHPVKPRAPYGRPPVGGASTPPEASGGHAGNAVGQALSPIEARPSPGQAF